MNLIRLYEPVSRAQLAQRTGIFRSSVSDIVDQLVEEGLLVERYAAPRGRGRIPVMLYLNPDGFPVLGVSIQPTKTLVAVAGLTAEAHQTLFFETPQKPRDFVHKLSETIEQLGEQHGRGTSRPFEELGVSVPGLVQSDTGRILWLPYLPEYSDFRLGAELQKETGVPTAVENDSNLAALAELWLDETADLTDFVVLVVDNFGVGSGIVLNRELYLGHDASFAAEFGHMIIDPTGPRCSCGRYGCFELYTTNFATWRRYSPTTNFAPSRFEDLLRSAQQGHPKALDALYETARYLSIGVSNIVLALNPQVIILAGQISKVWDSIRGTVEGALSSMGLRVPLRTARLESDQLYLHGAIRIALAKAFAKPKLGW